MLACSILVVALLQLTGNSDTGAGAVSSSAEVSSQQPGTAPTQDGKAENAEGPQTAQQSEPSQPGWFGEAPVPATSGPPGIFSVQTAESLPKGVLTTSAYANSFGTVPGSVTVFSGGLNIAAGLTKKLMVFAQFEPYIHFHVGDPSQLSLRQPSDCAHDVYKAPIYCGGPNPGPNWVNSWKGPAAAYVTGFPFAAYNNSDWGPLNLGVKYNFYSETRGDPLSVSLGGAFIIPTESTSAELAKFGAQTGTLDFSFTLALSKTLWREAVLATNVTYLVTRNPRIGNETLLTPGDVMIFGQGLIFRPQHRLQFLMEYTCEFTQEGHAFGVIGIDTENTSLGPADPVDGVWGARWYFLNSAAIDVGYRYMLNLHQLNNRSGFNIKVSKVFGWRKH